MFKSGFVNIIGRPNVGKSTIVNALVGKEMSIISYKPQTTRHRIKSILHSDSFQIVFSDTPGFVHDASYKMHEKMNRFVHATFEDADLMILVTDFQDTYDPEHVLIQKLRSVACPKFLVINKIDLIKETDLIQLLAEWKEMLNFQEYIPISATKRINTDTLFSQIIKYLPEGPPYYLPDQLSDRSERFFVSEMIREQIFLKYRDEIPYSCEVSVENFKEAENIIRIEAYIFVNKKSQKGIIIGKGGQAIKHLGIGARKQIETFFHKQVYLQLFVKVRENWRNDERQLSRFGYDQ